MRLVGAELLKIRTTSTWWIFSLILLPLWALAVLYNWGTANITSDIDTGSADVPADQAELVRVTGEAVNVATTLYTSGQFLGVLLVMLLGAIIVTNEFFHLTATTTFLTTPHRERVILAKLAAAVLLGLVFWLITTILNLIVVPLVLNNLDMPAQLGEPAIWRAIGLNALAFALWAIVGVGAGVLIRSQLGATLTLSIALRDRLVRRQPGVLPAHRVRGGLVQQAAGARADHRVDIDDLRHRAARQSTALGGRGGADRIRVGHRGDRDHDHEAPGRQLSRAYDHRARSHELPTRVALTGIFPVPCDDRVAC